MRSVTPAHTHTVFWQGTHSLFPFFFSPIKTKLSIFIWRNFISDSLECSHTHFHVKWWNDLQLRAVMQIKIPHDYCQHVRSVKIDNPALVISWSDQQWKHTRWCFFIIITLVSVKRKPLPAFLKNRVFAAFSHLWPPFYSPKNSSSKAKNII